MIPNFDAAMVRVRDALGARLGRPIVHGGVLATSRPLAMGTAELAALEAGWRFESEARGATDESRR